MSGPTDQPPRAWPCMRAPSSAYAIATAAAAAAAIAAAAGRMRCVVLLCCVRILVCVCVCNCVCSGLWRRHIRARAGLCLRARPISRGPHLRWTWTGTGTGTGTGTATGTAAGQSARPPGSCPKSRAAALWQCHIKHLRRCRDGCGYTWISIAGGAGRANNDGIERGTAATKGGTAATAPVPLGCCRSSSQQIYSY